MRWIALQVLRIEPVASVANVANVVSVDGVDPQAASAANSMTITFEAALLAICAISLRFTPRVAVCGSAVVMEVSGSLRLFGGLLMLAQLLKANIEEFFKQNSLLAHVFSAQAATSLIAIGRLKLLCAGLPIPARVANLPMYTLGATHPHLAVLERTGCRTWGDLLGLPRDGVARRFGAPLLAALDQARGALPEPYMWHTLPEQFEQKIELDALVIHAPQLMAGIDLLLVQLHAWLLGRQSGLCALKLVWHLDKRKGGPEMGELVVRTAQPAQRLEHVARLIAERLNQSSLSAPVHSLSLLSLETVSLRNAANATASLLMEHKQRGTSIVQFIERLSARLGPDSVQMWQPNADHRPEAMQRWVNAAPVATIGSSHSNATKSIAASSLFISAKGTKSSKNKAKILSEDYKASTDALYPTWLLPKPLRLVTRAGVPQLHGPLVKLAGPQRLEATGWLLAESADIAPALRDYFVYSTSQGTLVWIYSERLALATGYQAQRDWYLQGVFA